MPRPEQPMVARPREGGQAWATAMSLLLCIFTCHDGYPFWGNGFARWRIRDGARRQEIASVTCLEEGSGLPVQGRTPVDPGSPGRVNAGHRKCPCLLHM
jgi:hypothetical protein